MADLSPDQSGRLSAMAARLRIQAKGVEENIELAVAALARLRQHATLLLREADRLDEEWQV